MIKISIYNKISPEKIILYPQHSKFNPYSYSVLGTEFAVKKKSCYNIMCVSQHGMHTVVSSTVEFDKMLTCGCFGLLQ
jgi:hypothetical protein